MPLADTLLRLAEPPALFEVRWSEEILREVGRVLTLRFAKSTASARYREAAMRKFFPQAMVTGHEGLIQQMENHPKDRHVLAAAIFCRADYLVTFNLKDFPLNAGEGTTVVGPTAFLKILWKEHGPEIEARLKQQAAAIGFGVDELVERLGQSVPGFTALLRS